MLTSWQRSRCRQSRQGRGHFQESEDQRGLALSSKRHPPSISGRVVNLVGRARGASAKAVGARWDRVGRAVAGLDRGDGRSLDSDDVTRQAKETTYSRKCGVD